MTDEDDIRAFRLKARENMAAAASEMANGRFNTATSRCYYAVFLAAIATLVQAGIRPAGEKNQWGHRFVHAQFAGQLIARRKLFPSSLRDVLPRLLALRQIADYDTDPIGPARAQRALRRADNFLTALQVGGEEL